MKLFSGKVDFVTGLNYFHEDSESGGTNYQRRGTSTYSAAGGAANGNANRDLVITHARTWTRSPIPMAGSTAPPGISPTSST